MTEKQHEMLGNAIRTLQKKTELLRSEHPEISWGATGVKNPPPELTGDPQLQPVCTEWSEMIEPEWSAARKIINEILAELPKPDRARLPKLGPDNLWIWGGPTPYWGGSLSDDTLIRGAEYFGIRNAFYMYGPTTEKMIALHGGFDNLLCQVNTLCRSGDQIGTMTDVEMAELVSRFSLKYPNIRGAICDDATTHQKTIDPEPFRRRFEALKKHNAALKMYGVAYAHELGSGKDFSCILPYTDGVNLWFWSMDEILEYDRYAALCHEKFPGKSVILGIFIHEYSRSDAGAFPELLVYQLDKARESIAAGVLDGVIVMGDREIRKWPETSRTVRDYLRNQ